MSLIGLDNNSAALLYSQIQHPPGTYRRKISKHTSQGTSPGRTAWLITVIRLMGEDYLIETTGHLSHPTHWERLTSYPQGCYLAALQSLCLGTAPAAAPRAEGTAEPLGALAAASQAEEEVTAPRCGTCREVLSPASPLKLHGSPCRIQHKCLIPSGSNLLLLPHTNVHSFSSMLLSFSYFCLSPALQKTLSI